MSAADLPAFRPVDIIEVPAHDDPPFAVTVNCTVYSASWDVQMRGDGVFARKRGETAKQAAARVLRHVADGLDGES